MVQIVNRRKSRAIMQAIKQSDEELPSESFELLIRFTSFMLNAVGLQILKVPHKIGWRVYLVFISIVIYFAFTISTILAKIDEEWTYALEALCMLGSVLQGMMKLYIGLFRHQFIQRSMSMLTDVYKTYEIRGPHYRRELHGMVRRTKRMMFVMIIIYFLAVILIVGMPIVMLLVSNRYILMMHFHVPGFDVDTRLGFWVTQSAHILCIIVAAFGLFAGDSLILMSCANFKLFVIVLKLKVEELNKLLEQPKNRFKPEVRAGLSDIVHWHQVYAEYVVICDQAYNWSITCQVSTSGISIVLTIFVLLTTDWPVGYAYLPVAFWSLYAYCMFGTFIEICNDDFTDYIYNILWYNMLPSQQKTVRLILMRSQTPRTLNVAGVLPLSVTTALSITKTIYSITMMILQFTMK